MVVGILVDDAIVEIENIVRHLRMGKSPLDAARDAADEIGTAVIATSLTLAAVFVPVAFMPGIAGKFFREFGWTAATAVLFSLLVARLLTPMMAAYMLKAQPDDAARDEIDDLVPGLGRRGVAPSLDARWCIATGAVLRLAGDRAASSRRPSSRSPTSAAATSASNCRRARRLQDTVAVAEQARALLGDIPELKQVYTTVGSVLDLGDPTKTGVGEARKATLVLDWGNADDRDRDQKALERDARARDGRPARRAHQLHQHRTRRTDAAGAGRRRSAAPAGSVAGTGTRPAHAERPGQRDVDRRRCCARKSSSCPDPARAADLGVATADIAEAARIATSGDYMQRLAKFNLPERQVPIRVGFDRGHARRPGADRPSCACAARTARVPLAAVADITEGSGPSQISRYQRQRNVTFTAELNGRPLGDVMTGSAGAAVA